MAHAKQEIWYCNVPSEITEEECQKRFQEKFSDFIKEQYESYIKRRETNNNK